MLADPVREMAEKIVKLGLADALTLAPFIHAHRQRQLSGSTQSDDDEEARDFLTALELAKVIDRPAAQRLVRELEGGEAGTPLPPPQRPISTDPFVGKRFGDYRLLEKIGEGGMGSVYRAERDDGDRGFVVKLLAPLASDAASYVRFRREGEVMMALAHPNVVRVYQMGEESGLCYIVMEFIDGPSLQAIYEKKGRFAWSDAAKAIRQIALGLDAAHQMGVIHRDVKPQNVMLDRARGVLKVADFGLAKSTTGDGGNVSRAGDILGSPAYIAPEQWGDHDVDSRADIFALGVVFYQLVTGVLPFRGRTPADYARAILAGKFEPILDYAPDTFEGARDVVVRMLERRREDRYPSATALVADLERILRGDLPDVPRLVRTGETPERYVLLGREAFEVGSNRKRDVVLDFAGVGDKHARLERTTAGLILKDLETPGGTRVNQMRVREIALKEGDVIEFGQAPPLKYRTGNVEALSGATPNQGIATPGVVVAKSASPTIAVHGLVFEALVRAHHPRAVVAMIELLDDHTRLRRVERARKRLVALEVDADVAERAKQRGLASLKRLAALLPEYLFQATRENLGSDPHSWLGWWLGGAHERYPAQVRPPGARARGALALSTPSENGATVVQLKGADQWVIGRGSEADIRLVDRSVSRRHTVVHRLLSRYCVKDEGSRFGTVMAGERRPVALLKNDDVFELGRAKLLFREPEDSPDTKATTDVSGVEWAVFEALAEMRSPHVVLALINLLDHARLKPIVEKAASELEALELEPAVKDVLDARTRLALEALPVITQVSCGADLAAWRAWFATKGSSLPKQVGAEGWNLLG